MGTDLKISKRALVTGANRGIGMAIAQALSENQSIHVLAACRTFDKAKQSAETIGNGATGVVIDLTEPDTVIQQSASIKADYGPVDILVNNAGILLPGTGLEITTSDLTTSQLLTRSHPLP